MYNVDLGPTMVTMEDSVLPKRLSTLVVVVRKRPTTTRTETSITGARVPEEEEDTPQAVRLPQHPVQQPTRDEDVLEPVITLQVETFDAS